MHTLFNFPKVVFFMVTDTAWLTLGSGMLEGQWWLGAFRGTGTISVFLLRKLVQEREGWDAKSGKVKRR